ncbi:hypothetical protein, partial [Aphanothece microscopica]|uniref:hypothetical protein n=1 Tax=Aphanothece microscopica TaxID=1049561 RepID=UPI0039850471
DGLLVQVIKLEGLSFETADTEELNYRKAIRDTMLRAIAHPRFALLHHVIRAPVRPALDAAFPDPFSATLDQRWKARLETRALFLNDLYLTLVRRPPAAGGGWLDKTLDLFRPRQAQVDAAERARALRELDSARDGLMAALGHYGARV